MSAIVRIFLYPALALTAFGIFVTGLAHLLFCQTFFFAIPGLIDGIFVLIAAFHGIFLRYPNRCHFVLQCIATMLGFTLVILSVFELFCVRSDPQVTSTAGGVCYALEFRTGNLVKSCNDALGGIQSAALRSLKLTKSTAQQLISGTLVIFCSIQLLLCASLAWYSGVETKIRARAYHWQIPLGVAIIAFGCVHFVYCCTYYYIAFGVWAGVFILIQASVSWHTECKGVLARTLNVIGSAIGMALTAANGFGFFCWFSSIKSDQFAFKRHCQWRDDTYRYCYRSLEFSYPYIDWPKPYFDTEVSNLQFAAYASLLIGGLVQFALSLRSTFRR
uniref:Transmembrane protein n=1 Tax=Plectus sambesii TaxID=2011161 RepID=A0A914V5N7_9BILA